jgi:flagellar basal-body rod protein FlgC
VAWFNAMISSASGLTAERLRMDIISNNIANANTTRTDAGGPFRRRVAVLESASPFETFLQQAMAGRAPQGGVRVAQIIEDQRPFKVKYDPTHPDADESGYVKLPNVEVLTEMVDLIGASRAYEANVTALNAFKSMALKALEIGR